ncbi:DUF262 domain-containing protein [Janibacter indicus]|uniref:DUF262 domain-containing protein n=1 Tax=Janibacter indicus TaxID=857417 RepID=UPI003D9A68CB
MAQSGEITLPKVIQGRLLEIADYQRPYAWERKQLDDLWEDLDLLGQGHHYAGTLVVKNTGQPEVVAADGDALDRYEVVDGQQRLTTCLLLLDRVRRALEKLDVEGSVEVAARLRVTYGLLKVAGVDTPRLSLGAELQPIWKGHILGSSPIADATLISGAKRLRDAAEYFDGRIRSLTEGQAANVAFERLVELQRRLVSGLRFLVYEVENDAEVGVVFETLNERGRSLTEVEKVKNYLLYLARQLPEAQMKDLAASINDAWSHIFRMLSRRTPAFEERLLRAYWLCAVEPDARQWKRIASVKAKFPRSKYVSGSERLNGGGESFGGDVDITSVLYEDVKALVEGLRSSATYLAELYDDDADYHAFGQLKQEIRSATAALRRSPVIAIFQPVILAFRLAHPQNARAYLDLIRMCETYSARVFAICQRRSNAGEPYLARIAHRVHQQQCTPAEAIERIGALLWEYASDEEVSQNLLGRSNWYARSAHKYVLYEYERSFAKSDSDVIAWGAVTGGKTTEHILPQNPAKGSQWIEDFGDQVEELKHTLGNLVLTYDNSVYSNKEYSDKRGVVEQTAPKCYFSSTLASELEVAKRYPAWTPEAMLDRQGRIAHWAMEHWSVASPTPQARQVADSEVADELEQALDEEEQSDDA